MRQQKLQEIYNEKLNDLPAKQLEFNRLERDVGVLGSKIILL